MNDQLNQDKGFLGEKLGGFQVEPPASVWNAIVVRMGSRKRRSMIFIALAAAASLALAITLGIRFSGTPPVPGEAPLAANESPVQETTGPVQEPTILPAPGTVDKPDEAGRARKAQGTSLEQKVIRVMEETAGETRDSEEAALAEPGSTTGEVRTARNAEAVLDLNTSSQQTDRMEEEPVPTGPPEGTMEPAPDEMPEGTGEALGEIPVPEKDPRWVLGAALSPLYSFRDAQSQYLAAAPDPESGIISYAAGVRVGYRTTRRLAVESGIFFNKMGIDIGAPGIRTFTNDVDFAPIESWDDRSGIMAITNTVGNIVSSSGDIYVNNYKLNAAPEAGALDEQTYSPVNAGEGIRQHLDYLEVPLNLRYTVVDRDFKVQLVGGLSTNLLVNNYVTMETADGPQEIGYLSNIRNVNYSGNAGIGLSWSFLEHLSLSLEPRFRYFLNSVNDATLPATRPYTFGLYTGLNYLF